MPNFWELTSEQRNDPKEREKLRRMVNHRRASSGAQRMIGNEPHAVLERRRATEQVPLSEAIEARRRVMQKQKAVEASARKLAWSVPPGIATRNAFRLAAGAKIRTGDRDRDKLLALGWVAYAPRRGRG